MSSMNPQLLSAASGIAVGVAGTLTLGRILRHRFHHRLDVPSSKSMDAVPLPDPEWTPGSGSRQKEECMGTISIKPSELPPDKSMYPLLISAVTPRPIAFVSSVSGSGVTNLAPFSFFGLMCHDPPTLAFCTVHRNGQPKDTLSNLRETKECVVNMISEDFVEAANCCCGEYPPEVDEFELSGLTKVPSISLPNFSPPRVREAKVQMECRVIELKDLVGRNDKPTATMIICNIENVHLQSSVHRKTERGSDYVDHEALKPISRLGGNDYGRVGGAFTMARPPSDLASERLREIS